MSKKRKIKKEKILHEERINALNNEINQLKEDRERLEKSLYKISEKQKEEAKIKNVKVFKLTLSWLAPFVLSSCVIAGVGFGIGYNLPFKRDKIKKYHIYNFEYQTDNGTEQIDEYQKKSFLNSEIPESYLTVYTPWNFENDKYVRYKVDFEVNKIYLPNLIDAIINNDYEFIKENLKKIKEEKQFNNKINIINDEYHIEASIHMIDEKDVLYNIETKNENKIVTLVELLLSLAAGILINHCTGNLNLSNSIDWACYEYDKCKLRIYEIKNDIKKIDDKILALNKKRG